MSGYKFDRTVFKMTTAEEASNNYAYWLTQSYSERLRAAYYLNSVAFNFDLNNPPKMDKTIFKMIGRK